MTVAVSMSAMLPMPPVPPVPAVSAKTAVLTPRMNFRRYCIQAVVVLLINVPIVSSGLTLGWVSLASGENGEGVDGGGSEVVLGAASTFLASLVGVPLSARALAAGRKVAVIATSLAFLVCWALTLCGSGWWVVTARAAAGLGGAGAWAVAPLLAQEMCEVRLRGAAVAASVVAHNLGFLLMYIAAAAGMLHRTVVWWCAALSAAHCGAFLLVPESPAYLAANSRLPEARSSLARLRGESLDSAKLDAELDALPLPDLSYQSPIQLTRDMLSVPCRRRAFMIAAVAVIGQEMCGVLTLLQFAERVFVLARDAGSMGVTSTPLDTTMESLGLALSTSIQTSTGTMEDIASTLLHTAISGGELAPSIPSLVTYTNITEAIVSSTPLVASLEQFTSATPLLATIKNMSELVISSTPIVATMKNVGELASSTPLWANIKNMTEAIVSSTPLVATIRSVKQFSSSTPLLVTIKNSTEAVVSSTPLQTTMGSIAELGSSTGLTQMVSENGAMARITLPFTTLNRNSSIAGASVGGGFASPAVHAVVLGVVQLVASVIALYLVEKIGRRRLLIWGAVCTGASIAAGGVLACAGVAGGAGGASLAAVLALAVAADSAGLQPASYALLADLFQYQYRGLALSLVTAGVCIGNALEVLGFAYLVSLGGLAPALLTAGLLTLALAGFAAACVPETRGRLVDDVYKELCSGLSCEDHNEGTKCTKL